MARDYRYLKGTGDDLVKWRFSEVLTGAAIEARYPKCARTSSHYARVAFDAARKVAKGEIEVSLEFHYLFALARELMTLTKGEHRREPDMANRLAPYALVFVETLQLYLAMPETEEQLDWDDDEQVLETFVATYGKVKYANDENFPRLLMNQANARPLRIRGKTDKMLRLLSYAYHMQKDYGAFGIYLPVRLLGELLDCSPTFVSRLIDNARSEGYIETIDAHYSKERRKAKTHRFVTERLTKSELPKL